MVLEIPARFPVMQQPAKSVHVPNRALDARTVFFSGVENKQAWIWFEIAVSLGAAFRPQADMERIPPPHVRDEIPHRAGVHRIEKPEIVTSQDNGGSGNLIQGVDGVAAPTPVRTHPDRFPAGSVKEVRDNLERPRAVGPVFAKTVAERGPSRMILVNREHYDGNAAH